MIHLLDANVLLALGDENHPHNSAALRFMETTGIREGWASCPLTENAFLRIMSRIRKDGISISTAAARDSLLSIIALPGHQFWPDDLSLGDLRAYPNLPNSNHLTDFYLLALASKHRGRLATFDRRIHPDLISGGTHALMTIPVL